MYFLQGKRIAIFGSGTMGSAIAYRVIDQRIFAGRDVLVTGRNEAKLEALRTRGVQTEKENVRAAVQSDILLLAVKPKDMAGLCGQIAAAARGKLVLSIAAGIPLSILLSNLDSDRIVRAMPNLALTVGEAFTGLAPLSISGSDRRIAEAVFGSFGKCAFFEENQLDAITGIAGSGPAFFFLLMDAMVSLAEKYGIGKEQARSMVIQTLLGTARVAEANDSSFKQLIRKVKSKRGTTEAGLQVAGQRRLYRDFQDVVQRAIGRAEEMGK